MHDAGAADAADPRQLAAAVGQQGVDQGRVRVAGCGVHHQSGGLVHHDYLRVLVDHVERERLWLWLCFHGFGDFDGESLTGFDPK